MPRKTLNFLVYVTCILSFIATIHMTVVMGVFSPWAQPDSIASFSWMNVAGYAAIFLVSLLGVMHLRRPPILTPTGMKLVYAVTILATIEILAILPCFLFKADALCGVFSIMLHQVAGPAAVIILLLIIVSMHSSRHRKMLIGTLVGVVLAILIQHQLRAPKTAEDCIQLTDDLGKSNCINQFALRTNDADLCMKITFQTTRFSCLYRIAAALKDSSLCERIKTLPTDDEFSRNHPSDDQFKETCLKLAK